MLKYTIIFLKSLFFSIVEERKYILFKHGLIVSQLLNKNKAIAKANKLEAISNDRLIDSFDKLSAATGITKASLIGITQGKINLTVVTLYAILDGFGITLSEYATIFDNLTSPEVKGYAEILNKDKKERIKKKEKAAKRSGK